MDTSGELMRYIVNQAGKGNFEVVKQKTTLLQTIYNGLRNLLANKSNVIFSPFYCNLFKILILALLN
jgi:predicted translin family RNA/ssDNA-binding protein